MSIKFLKRLSNEELFEIACCLMYERQDELKLVEVNREECRFIIELATKQEEYERFCEFNDFKVDGRYAAQQRFCRAMYRKFGQEYSDAFFKYHFCIKDEDK